MSTFYNTCYVHWLDANGIPCTSFWTTLDQSDSVPGGLLTATTAAQALSQAKIVAVQSLTTHVIGGTGSTGDYKSVMDRAEVLGRISTTGRPARFAIPAPKQSIFLGDNETLDLSNADVLAWWAASQSVLGDTSGNALGDLIRGYRSRARGGG